jgi:hypothetical protein
MPKSEWKECFIGYTCHSDIGSLPGLHRSELTLNKWVFINDRKYKSVIAI